MSRSVRIAVPALLAALLAWTASPSVVVAAPDPDRPAPRIPDGGKGDTDGDRIADDLEAAVATLAPGDRVPVIVQGAGPADARRAAASFRLK